MISFESSILVHLFLFFGAILYIIFGNTAETQYASILVKLYKCSWSKRKRTKKSFHTHSNTFLSTIVGLAG